MKMIILSLLLFFCINSVAQDTIRKSRLELDFGLGLVVTSGKFKPYADAGLAGNLAVRAQVYKSLSLGLLFEHTGLFVENTVNPNIRQTFAIRHLYLTARLYGKKNRVIPFVGLSSGLATFKEPNYSYKAEFLWGTAYGKSSRTLGFQFETGCIIDKHIVLVYRYGRLAISAKDAVYLENLDSTAIYGHFFSIQFRLATK